jgi:hypothetical protein
MAMEFMEGQDLDKLQDQLGAMPVLAVLQHGIEVCIILRDYLHSFVEMGIVRPIIHRDIKPANIQILRRTHTACLLDFGISRFESQSAATMARGGTRAGSPAFAMRELTQKGGQISLASDIGCLCATLWALIANAKEFPDTRAEQLQAIRTFIKDPELQAVLIRGTDENPAGRYQSAEELRLELVRVYEAHQPLPAHLQPVVVPQTAAPAAVVVPVPTIGRYKIVWGKTPTVAMLHGTEYQRDLMGKVMRVRRFRHAEPVPQVNVVVADIVDSGGGHPTGVSRELTDQTGYFHLDQQDTRVPIAVVERRLRIVVEETTGRPIHDETIAIKRPRMLGQRAGQAARNVGGALTSPFQAAGHGIASRARSIAAAATSWQLLVAIAAVLLVATFVGAALQKRWDWVLYIWPHLLIGAIALAYFGWKLRTKTFRQALRSAYAINFLVIIWIMGWLGYILS